MLSKSIVPLARSTLALAGEYAAAVELCRRGVYCQLTLGNHKKTDLIVDTGRKFHRVSVKAKQGEAWARVTGIWQPTDLLVFVDFAGKNLGELPEFYVLNISAWKAVTTTLMQKDKRARLNSENTLVWSASDGKKDGWKGSAVRKREIEKYKDRWPNFGGVSNTDIVDA